MKRRLSQERLEELIEEATVDAYGESEQTGGFYTMMDDNLRLPFTTQILGVEVTVESIDMTDDDDIDYRAAAALAAARGRRVDRGVPVLAKRKRLSEAACR